MKKNTSITFYCFSPLVMLITLTLEIIFALFTLLMRGRSATRDLIIIILICLATFQLSEYFICVDKPLLLWAKLGYIAITLLPAIGVHLVASIRKQYQWVSVSYGLATVFAVAYVAIPNAITGAVCGGNYVIFTTAVWLSRLYALYYIGILFVGLWQTIRGYDEATIWFSETSDKKLTTPIQKSREFVTKHYNAQGSLTRALYGWLAIGYLSFMIPTGVLYILIPATQHGAPSIMCGFALVLAFVLTYCMGRLLPRDA